MKDREDYDQGERERAIAEASKPNPNVNCLEGMQCPKCGSYGPFTIEVTRAVIMHDDGSEDIGGDESWGDSAHCRNDECEHFGTIEEFRQPTVTMHCPDGSEERMTREAAAEQMQNAIEDDYRNGRWGGIYDDAGNEVPIVIDVTLFSS